MLNTTPKGGGSLKKGVRIERGRKVKGMPTQILQAVPGVGEVESLVEVTQAPIQLVLPAVEEAFEGEVRRLAGERDQRTSRPPGRVR